MSKIELFLYDIKELLTVPSEISNRQDPEQGLGKLCNISVAISEGKISKIGNSQEIRSEFTFADDCIEIDCSQKVVCPALIDAHTHLTGYPYGRADDFEKRVYGNTNYAGIARKGGGILTTVQCTTTASDEELLRSAQRILQEFLRQGVATVEGKSGYGLKKSQELRQLALLNQLQEQQSVEIITTYLAHVIDTSFERSEYIQHIIDEIIPEAAKIANGIDVFCDQIAFTKEESYQILQAGLNHGLFASAHVDQTSPFGATEELANLPVKSLSHLENISTKGIEMLAEQNIVGIIFPTCSLHLDAPFAPALKLLENNISLAISTDWNPGSSPCSNLLLAAYLASRKMHMPMSEVIRGLTIHPAKALGVEHRLGSIEEGKQADLAVYALTDWRDLISQCSNTPEVTVIKNGKVIFA